MTIEQAPRRRADRWAIRAGGRGRTVARGLVALLLLVGVVAVAAVLRRYLRAESARDLVARIVERPGVHDQMCFGIDGDGLWGRFSPFSFTRDRVKVSVENFLLARALRDEVIRAVVENLGAVAADLEARPPRYSPREVTVHGYESQFMLLLDLNASEALPVLLRLEKSLRPYSGLIEVKEDPGEEWAQQRFDAPFTTRFHVGVLSAITSILAQEEFPPLLASELADQHREYILNDPHSHLSAPPGPLPPGGPRSNDSILCYDPILGTWRIIARGPVIAVTRPRIELVAGLGEEFLRAVPPGKRRGASAMTTPPCAR